MSRFFVGLALWALSLALAACGGDSNGTDPARDAELAEMVDTVVSTYDDLTVCTNKREGATAYVEDEDSAYVCKKGLWVVDDSLSKAVRPDSEKKSSSSAKAKSSSNETIESSSSAKSSSSKDGKSSSSDEKNSSSSSVVPTNSSSSSVVPLGCKTETEDNCEYGTLTDDRDGQTYKTVKIGEQWWMAENLNYAYTDVPFKHGYYTSDSTSWCYHIDAANCAKYGRLYTWAAAMDSAGIIPGNTANGCGDGKDCNLGNVKVRGVCPEGWHLPSRDEWDTLLTAVGGEKIAGIMLKSTEGWNNNGNGSDSYFFSVLPAGSRSFDGGFYLEGYGASFWSSTESGSYRAYYMYLDYNLDSAYLDYDNKYNGFSVRCLMA